MLKKILIANRGEIALRVIRACREMGIRSVAIYSDADRGSLHAREADDAVPLGAGPSRETYLVIDKILAAARETGAQAVHPGYGFLSERAEFSRAVRDAGLTFIGPPPEAIEAMGSKTAARRLAQSAGVPVVPGTLSALRDATEAATIAAEFGYPVLLKAAAGGGGKGMRVVTSPAEIAGALDAARREALNAFGDDAVYVEKYITGPRHVEIQILADSHGSVIAIGERECSVQRRHQKVIEESPSVAVTPELRRVMGDTAVRVARAAGYVNAGTCEFLLDRDGKFYFLEMNTRIQVEHPVTELVYGLDLVQWQIRIASGEKIPESLTHGLAPRGWAIECRITAEDPMEGFLPSTGRISALHVPSGPGVRWDGGIEVGSEVGLLYDPLLAKLIVWAPSRPAAIDRMRRALDELVIEGVETARDFHMRVMDDAEFRAGAIDIHWLERRLPSLTTSATPPSDLTDLVAAAGALLAHGRHGRHAPRRSSNGVVAVQLSQAPRAASQWLALARREALH